MGDSRLPPPRGRARTQLCEEGNGVWLLTIAIQDSPTKNPVELEECESLYLHL